jgi:2,6-dihydroxypseudooxynicotine hydrolase
VSAEKPVDAALQFGFGVCPGEESERMRNEASGVASPVVFPEGNHVCDNIPYKVRPLMADWMARQLRAAGV